MSKRSNKKYMALKSAQKALRDSFLGKKNPSGEPAPHAHSVRCAEGPKPVEPKGMPGGRCNVTACQREGAIFLNLGMIGCHHPETGGCYYCADCAHDIHNANKHDEESMGFSLFPKFDAMMERYHELWAKKFDEDDNRVSIGSRKDSMHDMDNYKDINQNPWGGSSHRLRDIYIASQLTNLGPRGGETDDNVN